MQEVEEGEKVRSPEGKQVTGPARIMDNWKVSLPMKRCKECCDVIAPDFQLEYLRKRVSLTEDHFDTCPRCRE